MCRDSPSMAEPCAADNGGQSRRVCSRLAAVYPQAWDVGKGYSFPPGEWHREGAMPPPQKNDFFHLSGAFLSMSLPEKCRIFRRK